MTAAKHRVAVVAPAGENRVTLGHYLRGAGFEVHECSELGVASAFGAIVIVDSAEDIATKVRTRMKSAKTQSVVIVTSRPSALRDLAAIYADRLRVLPAPAFGWDVVDALRAMGMSRPRGA